VAKWPYSSYRPGQREAAEALAKTVQRGGVFALSAPTGFGKTATLVHGLLEAEAERVLYLVRTRNEILPVIRELRRFGVDRYVFLYSARRMCPVLQGSGASVEDFWETCRLLRLTGRCSYYANLARLDEQLLRAILAKSESPYTAVETVSSLGFCPFFSLKTLIGGSRFIVATYPYLFRRDIFFSTFEPFDYSDFVIVVDEAHSLLNISSLLEARLSLHDIEAAQGEIERYSLPRDLQKALKELGDRIRGWLQAARPQGGLRRAPVEAVKELLGDSRIWEDAAAEVRAAKIREAMEHGAQPRIRVALAKIAEFAGELRQEGRGLYIFNEAGSRGGITVLPLEPCPVVREPLNAARAVVLASGTMPAPRLLKQVLCLETKEITYYDVELLHGNVYTSKNRIVVVAAEPTSKYTARTPSMYLLYARYILETYRVTEKAVLVVYPSYDFMKSVVSALQGLARREPLSLATEEPTTSVDDILRVLRRSPHTLINAVAGGKLVEGVEYYIDSVNVLGTVFVAGVPYPQPDDYMKDRLKAIAARTGDPSIEFDLYEEEAILRARQAIGRALRDPQRDRALVVLADTRYLRRSIQRKLRLHYDKIAYTIDEYRDAVWRAAQSLGT